jgi:hypothetical protein
MNDAKRRLRAAAAALVAVAAAGAALAAPAGAWEYTRVTADAGSVWLPPVFPFEDGRYTTYGPFLMFTTFDSPYLYRSPASQGDQAVQGIYLVQRWNGSNWYVASRQNTPAITIPAGARGAYLPRLWRSPGGTTLYNRGYFRVQWIFAWAADGQALGSTIMSPDRVGDLRCRQMLRPCYATAKYVRLGRTFATGGGW